MKKIIAGLIFVLQYTLLVAQTDYKVSLIAPPLLEKASAVIRNSETIIEINSIDYYTFKNKTAITILNSSGDDESDISIRYDKSIKIKFLKGAIFNEKGVQISKISEKDFNDVSAAENSLYVDDRVKRLHAGMITYPYTIEYEYELKIKQTLYFPSWYPVYSTGTSLEKSSLTVIHPVNFKMRFNEKNFKGSKEEVKAEAISTSWIIKDIQSIKLEPYSPSYKNFLPIVNIAPYNFKYDGITGSFSDWNEYGKWVNDVLLQGRQQLPATTIAIIKDIVKDIDNPKDKAKAIYQYMQQKTRYISVQIGIGGFQPYPAAEVDRLSYGDCKGLVNYTKALLDVAGITSYYTVVNAGSFKEDALENFASLNEGNHVILCLPFSNDTTWLECTSKQQPFGFLGDFTDDRLVVVCTPDGGKLARTPNINYNNNKQVRKATFKINEKGDLTGTAETIFEGNQYENHEVLVDEPFSEQVKLLSRIYHFPNLEVMSLRYTQDKKEIPISNEIIQLKSYNYAANSNNEMIVSLNTMNKNREVPKEIRNRTNPVYINRGFTDLDEFSYEIPDGYSLESTSKNINVEKPFGTYSVEISTTNKEVIFKRSLILKEGIYPVDQYKDLIEFYKVVTTGDNSKAYLKKVKSKTL